jgi:hypothetical protein
MNAGMEHNRRSIQLGECAFLQICCAPSFIYRKYVYYYGYCWVNGLRVTLDQIIDVWQRIAQRAALEPRDRVLICFTPASHSVTLACHYSMTTLRCACSSRGPDTTNVGLSAAGIGQLSYLINVLCY